MIENTVKHIDPNVPQNPNITITSTAQARIKALSSQHGNSIGLRISVKDAGCSGKKYDLSLLTEIQSDDYVITLNNEQKVAVDKKSLIYLKDLTLDYIQEGLNKRFVFNNPHEKSSCGCGESFSI